MPSTRGIVSLGHAVAQPIIRTARPKKLDPTPFALGGGPAFAHDAVRRTDDGQVRVHFKAPSKSDATFAQMSPLTLLARRCALVPPPRFHIARYYGVLPRGILCVTASDRALRSRVCHDSLRSSFHLKALTAPPPPASSRRIADLLMPLSCATALPRASRGSSSARESFASTSDRDSTFRRAWGHYGTERIVMTDQARVLIDRDGAVAHVRLNRPEKRNGLDMPMFEQLIAGGRALAEDKSVRCVVLSGEGPDFCAGLDFKSIMLADQTAVQKLLERDGVTNMAQRVAWVWQELPVPVIAAVHGSIFGGGLQIALGCDMRYVHPHAQLSVMEITWGLIPDMSITKTLPPLVGLDVAKEMTFTGRRISGQEALAVGLATRVCDDPVSAALETAKLIASRSPEAIRAGKQLFNRAPQLPVHEAFELETELQLPLLRSPNQLEAVRANMMKQTPLFKDPA